MEECDEKHFSSQKIWNFFFQFNKNISVDWTLGRKLHPTVQFDTWKLKHLTWWNWIQFLVGRTAKCRIRVWTSWTHRDRSATAAAWPTRSPTRRNCPQLCTGVRWCRRKLRPSLRWGRSSAGWPDHRNTSVLTLRRPHRRFTRRPFRPTRRVRNGCSIPAGRRRNSSTIRHRCPLDEN